MFVSGEPKSVVARARGRVFVDLAEKAMQTGDKSKAEYFIDLAYEAMDVRYADVDATD